MKTRNILALLLTLAMMAATLGACAPAGAPADADSAAASPVAEEAGASGADAPAAAVETPAAPTGMPEVIPGLVTEHLFPSADKDAIIAAHTAEDGKTFVTMSITDDPGSMAPYGSGSDKIRNNLLPLVYERLFFRDLVGGEMRAIVGESYEEIEPGLWEVKIKQNVVDSIGNPIKAEDVRFSIWDIGIQMHSAKNVKEYIESIEIIDEYTLHFKMTLSGEVTFQRAIPATFVFSKASYEASPDGMITTPVGSGPYKLENWVSGSTVDFVINESYWSADNRISTYQQANVDRIIHKVIKDDAQSVIALESGEIDFLSPVNETDHAIFTARPDDYQINFAIGSQRQTLYFNCNEVSVLSNVLLRQAFCYAVDNEAVMLLASGTGKLAKTPGYFGCEDYLDVFDTDDYYDYNPEKAKELIAEAGFKPEDLNLVFMIDTSTAINVPCAEIIQAQLLEIGVNVEIKAVDSALYGELQYDKNASDVLLGTSGGSTDSVRMNYASVNFQTTSETNGSMHIVDDAFMELQAKALTCTAEEVDDYVRQLHYYIKDNAYGYALYNPALYSVVTPVTTGFTLSINGRSMPNACTYLWNA